MEQLISSQISLFLIKSLRPHQILITSYPKSGNTWLKGLLALYLEPMLTIGDILREGICDEISPRVLIRGRAPSSRIVKSHYSTECSPSCREIYLTRRPSDIVSSLFVHLTREYGTFTPRSFERNFIENRLNNYGTIRRHFELAQDRKRKGRTIIVRYEDMVRGPDDIGLLFERLHINTDLCRLAEVYNIMRPQSVQKALKDLKAGGLCLTKEDFASRRDFYSTKTIDLQFSDSFRAHLRELDFLLGY